MDSELLKRYGGAVPRYTSYPTAPHFHAGVTAATYRDWLGRVDTAEPISLYLHVPFCQRMCWYCGCHTKVVNRYEPIAAYAVTLAREAELVADSLPDGAVVNHLHWGGGTPTTLTPADFAKVMVTLRERFGFTPDAELAVEIDPRTLTAEMADALAAAGINRVSFGVQDFNARVQAAINRVQTFDETRAVVGMLRARGIDAINLDLMYGLPHQSIEDAVHTVDLASELAPARMSVFGYAHVPWMKTHQRMIDDAALPGTDERARQAEAIAERLIARGYLRIGLDHFARADDTMAESLKAGQLKRNFQGYTTDGAAALIGLGASSIGALQQGYIQNAPSIRTWRRAIDDGCLAVERGLQLSAEDIVRRDIIERLMCDLVVDLARYETCEGAPGDGFAQEISRLGDMAGDGIVAIDGSRIRVTEAGRALVRSVCAVFDTYLQTGRGRHSTAV
jgi:oxygen-independent coproporphyrinogen-3 oxidase